MTATDLVVTNDVHQLERLTPSAQEASVTLYLVEARNKLAQAVEMTGPAAVAAVKAEIATAADATRHLGLSKEIQTDAAEMVRRAEYALGKAIRAGQEAGEIRTHGQGGAHYDRWSGQVRQSEKSTLPAPTDYATKAELSGKYGGDGIYAMADNVTEEQFDAALAEAKDEGNVSRANVVRKLKGAADERTKKSLSERAEEIRALADTGCTSGQIGDQIGLSEQRVRDVARSARITIRADEVLRGTHRLRVDHNHTVGHLVMTFEVITEGLDRVDINALDQTQMQNWVDSLQRTTRAATQFYNRLKKETTQ